MDLNMHYALTSDGVRIAYGSGGEGRPLVRIPNAPFSYSQIEWRQSPFYDALCRNRQVVTFDPRGTGMSDRDIDDYSLDARLLDLEAIVDCLELRTFALSGIWHSGPMALSYAAQHPDRVSHLVLDDSFASARAAMQERQMRVLSELSGDWEAVTEHIAFSFAGVGGREARRYAEFMRSCTTHEAAIRMWREFAQVDVIELLPDIQAPTLIMQHGGIRDFKPDHARQIAALIPNARLVILEGKEEDDLHQLLSVMSEFLGDEPVPEEPIPMPPGVAAAPSAIAVILFADIVDSTALSEQLGDAAFRERSRTLEERVRATISARAGTPVEGRTLGDGVLATFTSASDAIGAAVACATVGEEVGLALHLGLHAGDVMREKANVYGQAVSIASRISGMSAPNEVLVSGTVRDIARASAGVAFEDRGEHELKGVSEPVRVFAVREA